MKTWLILILTCSCLAAAEKGCLLPPEGWENAPIESLSPRIQAAFVLKKWQRFRPSINLSVEPLSASLEEYVQAVRHLHEQHPSTRWRYLGSMDTGAGLGALTELDMTTEWGDVRMLQLLIVREGNAYTVTGAALKSDFPKYYKIFHKTLKNFHCLPLEDTP